MQRDLDRLSAAPFDLAVIGGGVIGVSVARDAARRGMKVALVERDDFACAASEAMSHLIHGGIRYLAQGHLKQVFQSLEERAIWQKIAPDHVIPQTFLMPLYGKGALARATLAIGAGLFELLGGKGIGRRLTASEAISAEPVLDHPALQGAVTYSDYRLERPEHLVMAMLADAAGHGAVVANHLEANGLRQTSDGLKLTARDTITGEVVEITAAMVANVTGPWTAQLASRLLAGQGAAKLVASKGIHILTHQITKSHAIALSGKGEHAFIVPFGSHSLVGTSDEPYTGDLADVQPTPAEIDELVERVGRLLPSTKPFLQAPVGAFAGVRALPGAAGDTYSASRDFSICDHSADGCARLYSVHGGKWTTARLVARKAVDRFATALGGNFRQCDTQTALIPPLQPTQLREMMAVTEQDRARRRSRLSMLESGVWSV